MALVPILVGSVLVFWTLGLENPGANFRLDRADSTADLIAAKGFVDGLNPYTDLYELSERYGIDYFNRIERGTDAVVHPRTPGALVMLSPLALMNANVAWRFMLVIGFVGILVAVFVLAEELNFGHGLLITALAFGTLSGPARWSYVFGTQSPVLGALLALFIFALLRDRQMVAGVMLGVVGSLKVFPLVLIVALVVKKKWVACLSTVVTLIGLNLLPILLPNIGLRDAVSAIASAGTRWFDVGGNLSMAAILDRWVGLSGWVIPAIQLTIVLGGVIAVIVRRLPSEAAIVCLLTIGVLASPLSWPHYLLILLPALLLVIATQQFESPWLMVFAIGVGMLFPVEPVELHTVGLIWIFAAVLIGTSRRIPSANVDRLGLAGVKVTR